MEEILHQLIGSLSHYLQGFIHPRWLFGISSINSTYQLVQGVPSGNPSYSYFNSGISQSLSPPSGARWGGGRINIRLVFLGNRWCVASEMKNTKGACNVYWYYTYFLNMLFIHFHTLMYMLFYMFIESMEYPPRTTLRWSLSDSRKGSSTQSSEILTARDSPLDFPIENASTNGGCSNALLVGQWCTFIYIRIEIYNQEDDWRWLSSFILEIRFLSLLSQ